MQRCVVTSFMRGELFGERRGEGPAVVGGSREEVPTIGGIKLGEGLGCRRVETVGVAASEKVLGLGERPQALAGHEYLDDVRGSHPLDEAAAVKLARAVGGPQGESLLEDP